MTPEEIEELKTALAAEVGVLSSTVISRLDNISDSVSESKISQGVQAGICRSLNGGSCPITPGIPNPVQWLEGQFDKLNDLLNGADLLQNSAMGEAVDRIDQTVHHSTHGIQKIFEFGEKAWEATRADKVLQVVNTTLLVHNAMMLSNNLLIPFLKNS